MEINTFWKIVLKSIGLWLIVQGIYFVPQLYTLIVLPLQYTMEEPTPNWIYAAAVLILLLYILIVRTFLFSSTWIINTLKLDRHFTSDRIDLNVPETRLLSIVTILLGAIVFVESLPFLVGQVIKFFQQGALLKDYGDAGWILYGVLKTLMAYFVMTNSKTVVGFIERQNSK